MKINHVDKIPNRQRKKSHADNFFYKFPLTQYDIQFKSWHTEKNVIKGVNNNNKILKKTFFNYRNNFRVLMQWLAYKRKQIRKVLQNLKYVYYIIVMSFIVHKSKLTR